jgi:hypothetical protein
VLFPDDERCEPTSTQLLGAVDLSVTIEPSNRLTRDACIRRNLIERNVQIVVRSTSEWAEICFVLVVVFIIHQSTQTLGEGNRVD